MEEEVAQEREDASAAAEERASELGMIREGMAHEGTRLEGMEYGSRLRTVESRILAEAPRP